MGWHLSPALFWQLSNDDNIDVQSVFSCAPKLAVWSCDYHIFWDG